MSVQSQAMDLQKALAGQMLASLPDLAAALSAARLPLPADSAAFSPEALALLAAEEAQPTPAL